MAVKEIWTPKMKADWELCEANKPEPNYQWLDNAFALSTKTYTCAVSGDTVTFDYNGKPLDRVTTNPNDIWRDDGGYARHGYKSKNGYWTGCGYNFDNKNESAWLNQLPFVRLPHVVGITMKYRWPTANDSSFGAVYINREKRCWFHYFNYRTRQRTYLRCVPCEFTGRDPTESNQAIGWTSDDWSVMTWRLNINKTAYVNENNLDFMGFTFQFEFPSWNANIKRLMDLKCLNLMFDTESNAVPILFKRRLNPWSGDTIVSTPPEFFLKDPS